LRRRTVRDIDVGVFLDSTPSLTSLIRIAGTLEDTLGLPVDVVPLTEMPPKLRLKAL
jgi:predicted nucleotidyltransferase